MEYQLHQLDFAATCALAAEEGGADLIVTSPPYCDARTYGAGVSWGMEDYQRLGDALFLGLKPGGTALVVIDAPVRKWRKGMGTERGLMPFRVLLDWADRVGFRVPDRLAYGRYPTPGAYGGRFKNEFEWIYWLERPGGDSYFDKRPLSVRSVERRRPDRPRRNRLQDGTMYKRVSSDNGRSHRSTLWHYRTTGHSNGDLELQKTDHPARYCLRFAQDAVTCFSPPGGLVVDPFVGSGTSGIAATTLGRRFLGGDLFADKDGRPWADVAGGLIEARLRQQRLFG
jgi:hypothetical protein